MVPKLEPFTFHWYEGLSPPLVGVAVKSTEVPEQTGFAEAPTKTLTVACEFMVTVTSKRDALSQPVIVWEA